MTFLGEGGGRVTKRWPEDGGKKLLTREGWYVVWVAWIAHTGAFVKG